MTTIPADSRQQTSEATDVREVVARLLKQFPDGVLPILQAGDPVLRQVAQPYKDQLGDLLEPFLKAMRATMLAAPGVGLAAPQVGVSLAIAVVHDPGSQPGVNDPRHRTRVPHRTIINPYYEPVGEELASFYEGCLSVNGWQAVRTRYFKIRLTGRDEHGQPIDEVLEGWPARIMQHETDHLRGELYIDRSHTRSLSTNENMQKYWAQDMEAREAARILGFELAD